MSTEATTKRPWSRAKWILTLALVFAAHIGFIFAFGSRVQPVPREAVRPSAIHFNATYGDWQELNDPTLFARPQARGFAGATWMKWPEIKLPSFQWADAPRPLELDATRLGEVFSESVRTGETLPLHFEAVSAPEVVEPDLNVSNLARSRPSSFRIGGALTQRKLLEMDQPGVISSADIITNTVVQVLVDGNGFVASQTVLSPGSGSVLADRKALELARGLRFEPVTGSGSTWTLGTMIFEWQTSPQSENSVTNAPLRNP